jgi:hypothetical protein
MGVRLAGAKAAARLPPLPAATFPCKRGANPKRSGDGRRSPSPRGSARRGVLAEQTEYFTKSRCRICDTAVASCPRTSAQAFQDHEDEPGLATRAVCQPIVSAWRELSRDAGDAGRDPQGRGIVAADFPSGRAIMGRLFGSGGRGVRLKWPCRKPISRS